jgi:beta-aspartyl-peptidase (threonine type)
VKPRRRLWSLLALLGLALSAHAAGPVLVIHGGAGVLRRDMPPAREKAVRAALTLALRAGYAELKAGKPSVDAVTASLAVLEDDPLFNAGRGSVFTHAGTLEMDAAIMDGYTLRAGSVAAVSGVRHPIQLARAVMEHTPHVMLVGGGAEAFAQAQGLARETPAWFRTEERWQQLQQALREDAAGSLHDAAGGSRHFGTVGAVALDAHGHLAAGTSTGGTNDKMPGRVGDSPIIGAGTYANASCAISGTGWGEFYMRTVAAYAICSRVTQLRVPLARAAAEVINQEIPAMGGSGGAIALDDQGHIAMPFNTDGMFRGWIDGAGVAHVAIYGDEDDGTGELLPAPAPAPDDAASGY